MTETPKADRESNTATEGPPGGSSAMKWSWRIGRVGGVDLRIHATFVILLAWWALIYYRGTGTASGAARGLLFTLALFGSVLLHELGHAFAARRFGVATRDITLLPIGGVSRLESMPRKPKQELVIALAGPAVTLAIVIVLAVVLRLLGLPATLDSEAVARTGSGSFLVQLMWVNGWLLAFNLLPAFPMDGGRVLRAALALRKDYVRATDLAVRVGHAFALVFGVVGFFYNPFLVLIALFVWIGATAESMSAREHSALSGVAVERLMIRDVRTLEPSDTLNIALREILEGFQHDFPVVHDGRVVGMLTRSALLNGLARFGGESAVADSMETSFRTTEASEPVERALARLRECRCQTLPVLSDDRLRGVLTSENVAEFVMIEAAARGREARHAA
jgi:Zn-dependent protease/predicted transcriptional regulator